MNENEVPVIQESITETVQSQLEPVHEALGAIMESISLIAQAISSLKEDLQASHVAAPALTVTKPDQPDTAREDLLKTLINPTTGRYTGVYSIGRRFQARVGPNPIGYFDTAEEAALARHAAKQETNPAAEPASQAQSKSPDRVKLERERRKTVLALEQAKAASKLAELKIKEEARLREVQFKEEARLAQIHERERLKDEAKLKELRTKDEAKLKEIREKEELRREADLQKIQARGDVRAAQIREKEGLVTQRKQKLTDDDRLIMNAVTAGWFPGRRDLPTADELRAGQSNPATPVKTVEQMAQEMSDWGDDLE